MSNARAIAIESMRQPSDLRSGQRARRLRAAMFQYGLYLLFHLVAAPFLGVRSLIRARKRGHQGIVWTRLWGGSPPPRRSRWIVVYAGGMGEMRAGFAFAEQIIQEREPDLAVLVQAANASEIRHASIASGVMPFNNPFSVALFLWRWRPKAIVGVEFWDNHHLAALAKLCRIRSLVFNVPVTEIALKNVTARNRWRYDLIDYYLCQGDEHAERMRAIARVEPARIAVTGPLCIAVDPVQGLALSPEAVREKYQSELGIAPDAFPVVVAGSTYKDEEEILLDAFLELQSEFPMATLILAPRGVKRPGGCDSALVGRGLAFSRRSERNAHLPTSRIALIDVTGELKYVYALGHVAFVGGSMGFQGSGHTPVEAMAWYLPISIGPVHPQQKIIVDALVQLDVAAICRDSNELAAHWRRVATDATYRAEVAQRLQTLLSQSSDMILRVYDTLLRERTNGKDAAAHTDT